LLLAIVDVDIIACERMSHCADHELHRGERLQIRSATIRSTKRYGSESLEGAVGLAGGAFVFVENSLYG
jgi:hypothetical protein